MRHLSPDVEGFEAPIVDQFLCGGGGGGGSEGALDEPMIEWLVLRSYPGKLQNQAPRWVGGAARRIIGSSVQGWG